MGRKLESTYELSESRLSKEEFYKALSGDIDGFRYFFEHCCQIQDKVTRQMIHPKLNKGQEMIAATLLNYISKQTRKDYHREVVIVGPRQFGKSTLITSISNYMMAYVDGCERINLVHTLQNTAAAGKYYSQKIAPIVTGVHPDIFPNIERNLIGSSTLLDYHDVKDIPRHGVYEITSAGSNSVRSSTVTVWLADEPSEYRAPEAVEDAISGAIGDYGFSFTAYIGTFSDRMGNYFLDKIKTAIDHPEEIDLVFIPWFLVYGREGDERGVDMNELNEYESEVIVPEMIKYDIPEHEWAQHIGWYRRRALRTAKMKYEFPTSIQDILDLTSDRCVFSDKMISKQRENVRPGHAYRLLTDNITNIVEAKKTDVSPFKIFKNPIYGHKYRVVVDPITAFNDNTDNFAMSIFDDNNFEQVAVFCGKNMPLEDYADYAVSIAKLYNNAMIVPESNMAGAFVTSVYGLRYYNLYYENQLARKKRMPGVRTTASNKESMIDNLLLLLDNDRIILHDEDTIDEMSWFEKKVKEHPDGSTTVKMMAKRGKTDDRVACLWVYVGSLDQRQLAGRKKNRWSVL